VIGGKEDSTNEASAAIEARIPCQRDKAMLKFEWALTQSNDMN